MDRLYSFLIKKTISRPARLCKRLAEKRERFVHLYICTYERTVHTYRIVVHYTTNKTSNDFLWMSRCSLVLLYAWNIGLFPLLSSKVYCCEYVVEYRPGLWLLWFYLLLNNRNVIMHGNIISRVKRPLLKHNFIQGASIGHDSDVTKIQYIIQMHCIL